MDVLPLDDGGVRFLEMPGAFFDQLVQLPETCAPGDDPSIAQRLNPPPLDPDEPEASRAAAEEDWAAYVRPELDSAFHSAMRAVLQDLSLALPSDFDEVDDDDDEDGDEDSHYSLEIPGRHVAFWFQVLNRARIVLAIKHRLPFSENPAELDEKITLSRLLAAHLSDHFAEILEILVHQMEREIP